uniref:NAD(P)H dehydrogenase (quinone) n=1 Tax=Aegilops tauschii TaxID=37682 RepID=R7W4Z7_AEGTA
MPVLRVAAISGSVRSNSWHVGLIRAAEELCEESIPRLRIDHVDISSLPMANPDLETQGGDGFPPAVEAFRDRVAADCFLFASPEYNYSVTGSLKNTLDWGSTHLREIGIYLTCTSSTSRSSTSGRLRAQAATQGELTRDRIKYEAPPKFDGEGNLIDVQARERLVLLSLQAFALRLQHKQD